MKKNTVPYLSSSYKTKRLAQAGIIAAMYVALTGVSAAFGLSSGAIQVRISEALCVLPIFTTSAIPGLWIGCMLSNLIYGGTVFDIIFGSLATLIGALGAYLLRGCRYLSPLPTIAANTAIVPAVLAVSGFITWDAFAFCALTVFIGEVISAGILGIVLISVLGRRKSLTERISDKK